MISDLCKAIQTRTEIVFENIMEDPSNMKFDRILIEYTSTLTGLLKECNEIVNGSPDQINIQNNINISVLDTHINTMYDIIRDILSRLDVDTSIMFIEEFNERMAQLKQESGQQPIIPVENRLATATSFVEMAAKKIDIDF